MFNQDNNYTDYKHFAYIGDAKINRYFYAQYCNTYNISLVGQQQYVQFKAFAVPKGAQYVNAFDQAFLNLTTGGNLTALQRWLTFYNL